MNRKGENKMIPKLRFPEFWNSGEWKETILGQCLLEHPDYGINAPAVPYSINLPTYLRITDISEEGLLLRNQMTSVEKEVTKNNYLEEGDIVLARTGASVGKSYKYRIEDGKLVFAGFLIRVKPDKNKLNSELLFQYLSTERYWSWVNFVSARSGQPGINGNEYSSMPLILPPTLIEQKKIAACLSSIDDLITAQSQKIEVLKAHKKGQMQQLFPTEGETVPMMRFAEFKDNGEWEVTILDQVADFYNGKAHENNISETGKYIVVNSKFISTDGEVRKFTDMAFCMAKKGEILMVLSDVPNGRAIAKCFYVDTDNLYTVNQRICKISPRNVVGVMLLYLLDRNSYFLEYDDGVKQTNLKKEDVLNCPIILPKDPEEQQKIADCLSSLDELISVQGEKLEALKSHKIGLMQQLFPAPNKVNEYSS